MGEFKCGKCGTVVEPTAPSCPACHFVFGTVASAVLGVDAASGRSTGGLLPHAARLSAYVSLGAAAFVFSVTRLAFPRVGFEGVLVWGGLSAGLCILAAVVSITLSAVLKLKGASVGSTPTILSLVAVGVITAATMLPG